MIKSGTTLRATQQRRGRVYPQCLANDRVEVWQTHEEVVGQPDLFPGTYDVMRCSITLLRIAHFAAQAGLNVWLASQYPEDTTYRSRRGFKSCKHDRAENTFESVTNA